MPGVRMQEVNDALACGNQSVRARPDGAQPPECLNWRCDLVARGGEDQQRVANATQVDNTAGADLKAALLDVVADEQVLDDGNDLFTIQEEKAAPPALEIEKPLALALGVVEKGHRTCRTAHARGSIARSSEPARRRRNCHSRGRQASVPSRSRRSARRPAASDWCLRRRPSTTAASHSARPDQPCPRSRRTSAPRPSPAWQLPYSTGGKPG